MVILKNKNFAVAVLFSAFLSSAHASAKSVKTADKHFPAPTAQEAETPDPADIEQNEFLTKISDIALNVVSFPKQTVKHVPFSSAYTLLVKDADGKEVSGMSITVSYPVSRTDDSIVYD
ncbi:MAG: hypothetical protein ACFNLN_09975, partial [Treponema socranskii subsp. buccale]